MRKQAGLTVALSVLALGVLGSPAARAAVTVYTSQAAFDAAFPAAQHINFDSLNPGPKGRRFVPPTVTVGGDEFTSGAPASGGLFALPSGNPGGSSGFGDYGAGVVFLSAQAFYGARDVLEIGIPAATAFGFDYGDYANLLDAQMTVSINGGTPFTLPEPYDVAQFIGFSSTTPIRQIRLWMYPDAVGQSIMDVIDVSQVPATSAPVPEPGGWALLLLGTGLLGAQLRRLRRPVPA